MKKLKNKKIRIYIHLFEFTVYIVFSEDVYKYRNITLLKGYPRIGRYEEEFDALHTSCNFLRKAWCILPNNCPISTTAHEVNHAVDNIVDFYGLEGTEIRSYLSQYIMSKIYG